MKSKKILATIVAFASFMAVATSGLAAVTTTTTYNEIADKVIVDVDVTDATPDSEVTYLVKSGENIVYIDQQTADNSGAVKFDYKIAKDKIPSLATSVQFGTNGDNPITDTTALYFANVTATVDANSTIAFYADADCKKEIGEAAIVGTEDVIYAKVTVADGFEISSVVGLQETATDNVYKVTANDVSVVTKSTYVEPGVIDPEQEDLKVVVSSAEEPVKVEGEDEPVEVQGYTKVLKVVGAPEEVGVIYNGLRFPALRPEGSDAYDNNVLYAVKIIVRKGVEILDLVGYAK